MRQWWPVAFLFALLVLIFCFIFLVAIPRSQPAGSQAAGGSAAHGGAASASADQATDALSIAEKSQRFADAIDQRQPKYTTAKWNCPVDDVELDVPQQASRNTNNRFGGVATDLMAVALGPPPAEGGRPSLDKQDWEMLLVTCPQCGATFHGIDLWQLQNGDYQIQDWNLGELVPALAEMDYSQWTVDERILVRVLTQRAAGVEDVELGFSAIQGAYAANFGTWYGKEVHIPSSAFYALAGAYYGRGLDTGEGLSDEARSITEQTMGEVYRLLGRAEDAKVAFTATRAGGNLDEFRLQVLDQVGALLASHDFTLQVADIEQMEIPPGGWYLSEMLPAINGHLAQHRADWQALDDPDQIINAIVDQLP